MVDSDVEPAYPAGVSDLLHRGRDAARALLSRTGVTGVVVEAAWVTAHLAIYPLGLLEDRLNDLDRHQVSHLPPAQRGLIVSNVEAAGTPIILVHGVIDNRSIFTVLRRQLERKGFGRVYALNYSLLTGDIRAVAGRLQTLVNEVCEQTGYEQVHIVGHSMGGIIARYYVQRMGGGDRVHTLVTLGTPHSGSWSARLVPWPAIRQLRLDSDVIAELREPAPGIRTRFIAVWSDLDQLVVPQRNARITHPDLNARNVLFRGIGHMSLPVDGRVAHEIAQALSLIDSDGNTVEAGITSIA